MFDDYVGVDTTPLYRDGSGSTKVCHLLWGDGVRYEGDAGSGTRRRVSARGGRPGWVTRSALGGQSLLEFYFIDVGQGDGILVKTPGFRHAMIDGGFPRSVQDTGKNAADFVDWKFCKDYGKTTIELDAMLASHCDADQRAEPLACAGSFPPGQTGMVEGVDSYAFSVEMVDLLHVEQVPEPAVVAHQYFPIEILTPAVQPSL